MASVALKKTDGKRKQKTKGQAVIGCFVKCQNKGGPVCAIVCRHVTKTASGPFFLEETSRNTKIARKKKNFFGGETESLKNDVDLIEFIDSERIFIQSVYRNISDEERKYRMFDGPIEELYHATVFQCYRPKGNERSISKSGIVLSTPDLHKNLRDLICPESNFVVDDVNGESFAKGGDSGRVVAREADDGCIELLGIITWGQFQCRTDPNNSGNYSICLLLRCAIKYLNQKYESNLDLYDIIADRHGHEKEVIEPGQIITFTTD